MATHLEINNDTALDKEPIHVHQQTMTPRFAEYIDLLSQEHPFYKEMVLDERNLSRELMRFWPILPGWKTETSQVWRFIAGLAHTISEPDAPSRLFLQIRVTSNALDTHKNFEPNEAMALALLDSTTGIIKSCVVSPVETSPDLGKMHAASGIMILCQHLSPLDAIGATTGAHSAEAGNLYGDEHRDMPHRSQAIISENDSPESNILQRNPLNKFEIALAFLALGGDLIPDDDDAESRLTRDAAFDPNAQPPSETPLNVPPQTSVIVPAVEATAAAEVVELAQEAAQTEAEVTTTPLSTESDLQNQRAPHRPETAAVVNTIAETVTETVVVVDRVAETVAAPAVLLPTIEPLAPQQIAPAETLKPQTVAPTEVPVDNSSIVSPPNVSTERVIAPPNPDSAPVVEAIALLTTAEIAQSVGPPFLHKALPPHVPEQIQTKSKPSRATKIEKKEQPTPITDHVETPATHKPALRTTTKTPTRAPTTDKNKTNIVPVSKPAIAETMPPIIASPKTETAPAAFRAANPVETSHQEDIPPGHALAPSISPLAPPASDFVANAIPANNPIPQNTALFPQEMPVASEKTLLLSQEAPLNSQKMSLIPQEALLSPQETFRDEAERGSELVTPIIHQNGGLIAPETTEHFQERREADPHVLSSYFLQDPNGDLPGTGVSNSILNIDSAHTFETPSFLAQSLEHAAFQLESPLPVAANAPETHRPGKESLLMATAPFLIPSEPSSQEAVPPTQQQAPTAPAAAQEPSAHEQKLFEKALVISKQLVKNVTHVITAPFIDHKNNHSEDEPSI